MSDMQGPRWEKDAELHGSVCSMSLPYVPPGNLWDCTGSFFPAVPRRLHRNKPPLPSPQGLVHSNELVAVSQCCVINMPAALC